MYSTTFNIKPTSYPISKNLSGFRLFNEKFKKTTFENGIQ